jgi:glyoxylase-like metal-dependent hydrolase (beta-lactamase superfamily II)
MSSPDRRRFLATAISGAIGVSLTRTMFARPPERDGAEAIQSTRLADDVFLISGAGGNVTVVSRPDGLFLINGGLAERASSLLQLLDEEFPGRPIRILFNTDWHRENTGLNEIVGQRGAKILAHENTKLWLGADVFVKWQQRRYTPLPKHALPNETFYTNGTMVFGQQPIVYGYLGQAHTDGDAYVYLPERDILIAGDVVTVGSYPVLDDTTGGWIGGITTAASTLLNVAKAGTRVVPGAGPVQTRAHLQAERDMLAVVRDRVVKMMKQGMGPDEMIAAAPTKDFDAVWGSPDLFMKNVYPGLWGHARELGGII